MGKKILKKISYVMSDDFLYDYLTVQENIAFFRNLFEEDEEYEANVMELCKNMEIDKYSKALVKNLSQGTRNKLYLALMMTKEHEILILDEPFTALDANTQKYIMEMVSEYKNMKNKSVIMVTHIEEFKKLATRTYVLERDS